MMKLRAFFDPYWEALMTLMNPVKAKTNSPFVNIILKTQVYPTRSDEAETGLGTLYGRDVDEERLKANTEGIMCPFICICITITNSHIPSPTQRSAPDVNRCEYYMEVKAVTVRCHTSFDRP